MRSRPVGGAPPQYCCRIKCRGEIIMLPIEQLQNLIQGKKVAFIGAGVSHKRCIEQFVELGAQVTLCDQKKVP